MIHCKQCDTPNCLRFDECQTLDIMRIPQGVDFIIYNVNGGTPVTNIGGVEMHGDTVQDSINNAVKEYKRLCAEEDAAKALLMERTSNDQN